MRLRPHGAAGALVAGVLLASAPASRADLAGISPFLPRGLAGADAPAGPSGPLELRGVTSYGQGALYCIYDTAKKRDYWVGLNEPGHDFVVRSADAGGDGVSVDFQGRSLHLVFRVAKVASAAPAPTVASVVPALGAPSPAEEQRRLDAVAQEVRRRRLEREKAAQGGANGAQPPSTPNR